MPAQVCWLLWCAHVRSLDQCLPQSADPPPHPHNTHMCAVACQQQLSCAGKDWTELPIEIAKKFGGKTKRLDLCYNELTTLRGVELFTSLQELVLDNNSLGDDVTFPAIKELSTLSLNKNQVNVLLVQLYARDMRARTHTHTHKNQVNVLLVSLYARDMRARTHTHTHTVLHAHTHTHTHTLTHRPTSISCMHHPPPHLDLRH
jgi:hypothetical protein